MASFDLRSGYTPTADFSAPTSFGEVIDDSLLLVFGDSWLHDRGLAIIELLIARDQTTETVSWGMVEQLLLTPTFAGFMSIPQSLAESFSLEDLPEMSFGASITEPLVVVSSLIDTPQKVAAILDQIILTSSNIPNGNVSAVIASTLVVTDLLLRNMGGDITEQLIMASDYDELVRRYEEIVDNMLATSTDTPIARLYVSQEETLDTASTTDTSGSKLVSDILDELFLGGLIVLPDGTAWVINTETKGLSEYTNFEFNSMTEINGKFYGANSSGIYELAGDDDDGTDIRAIIRTGLSDFGISRKKRVSDVYIGHTSTGQLVLKVIYNQDNEKREAWYRVSEKPDAHDTTRFKVGKGAKARYWGFELANEDGADFNLDQIELYVLPLNRRL